MKLFQNLTYSIVLLLLLHFSLTAQNQFKLSEDAYRANNRGVSLLEQFKSDEAEKQFRQALTLKPDFKLAKINLAIALFNEKKLDEAKKIIADFLQIEPTSLQAFYILGLIARSENNLDEALTNFRKVLQADPTDVGANVNAGQILAQKREYPEAIKVLQTAYDSEPFNLTAIYNLATSLQRSGEREKAAELLKKFQVLRDTSAGINIGLNYLEQGHYAEALSSTGAENELVDKAEPKVSFQSLNVGIRNKSFTKLPIPRPFSRFWGKPLSKYEILKVFEGGETLIDFDGDGDSDVAKIDNSLTNFKKNDYNSSSSKTSCKISLYRNVKGRFTDVSATSGDLNKPINTIGTVIISGDFDNDNLPDLLLIGYLEIRLYHNEGKGKFKDVTENAKFPKYPFLSTSAAFVDFDHDGDLDIFIAGFTDINNEQAEVNDYTFPTEFASSPNLLLRNNNDGTFTDISEKSKINQSKDGFEGKSVNIVPTDFNNSRDIDLVVANYDGRLNFFSNQRDDTFKDVSKEIGLNKKGNWSCVAAGDVNKDGYTDFFFGTRSGWSSDGEKSFLAISDGKGKFIIKDAPKGTENATASQFLDYDNDGLLDLIVSTDKGLLISRNLGDKFADATAKPFINSKLFANSNRILSADFDNDGDLDLLVDGRYLQNNGGNLNNSETLNLQGRVSNKSGIGAKVVMRAGSLAQQLESYSASPMPAPSQIHFGLGKRKSADSIRILWSSGIVQSETDFVAKSNQINIQEVDRKPASCPYLYTWDGEKFAFVTDFLGGGEMGGWAGKGVYNFPKSDEFVRIPQDKLKAKNGFYEIRVTNELEEVMYLDKVKLVAVEHDENSEVYPNEGLGQSEKPKESIISTQNAHPPISATNSKGENILPKIKDLDRVFYDDFTKQEIRGYADEHSLTLNLDDQKGFTGRTILLLTGWTDYAFSSDNVRASQSGRSLFFPYLQVKNQKGEWQTVIDSIGIPIGRPQTLLVDLTGKFLTDSREVRIVTNFRTYWDKIAVDTSPKETNLKTIEIEPTVANLRERGYSAETKFNGMDVPDYNKVSFDDRWKNFAGRFTRIGDVKPLLKEIDDVFVIAKAGDEFVLSFKELPAPPQGKTYTFLLFADGYSKEMDINSASPDAVYPLPFKGMKKYPYGAEENYPMSEEKRRIYDETLTRFSRGGLAKF
ncbi:MAG TPA: FG-GAP-like repeat-containing protein [Pyrinomonadaceae bacterium]|nr:FG-GAP-like repeat-containing protein [Pyrinomonadaceae bacterium]